MANIILSKESSSTELKCYFEAVLKLSKSDNEFPINLDECWMIAYKRKDHAVRSLKTNFIEGIDYKVSLPKGENLLPILGEQDSKGKWGGHNEVTYMLSVSCLEYFIARKVRPVFEVYRKVFHKVAKGITYTQKQVDSMRTDYEKRINKLQEDLKMERSKTMAVETIKKQETDLKNSCFYFLIDNRMYDKWNEYHIKREQEKVFRQLEQRRKELEELPYELPY